MLSSIRAVIAAALLALTLSSCALYYPDLTDPEVAKVIKIGRCEQPAPPSVGDRWEGIWWDFRGPQYRGGLGMMNGVWSEYRNPEWPSTADLGSPAQQVLVAQRLAARTGWGAWSCARKVGVR